MFIIMFPEDNSKRYNAVGLLAMTVGHDLHLTWPCLELGFPRLASDSTAVVPPLDGAVAL